MTRATFEVLPQQADFVECDALFSAAYGGIGSGKTYAAQWRMWRRLRQWPRGRHYVCGADFEQLRGGYFMDFRSLLEDTLRWREGRDYLYRDSPRPTIILKDTGARIRALSSELAERMRSLQIQSLHAEEPQTWHNGERVWRTLVGRMRHAPETARAHPGMPICAWMTFNPSESPIGSWLHDLIEKKWRAQGYPSWRFSLRDNYLLENVAQYIKNQEDTLPPHLWPVEIDGNWPTIGGDWYRGFDTSVHCGTPPLGFPLVEFDPRREILWGLDFNINPQASVVAQVWTQPSNRIDEQWQARILYIFDEIFLENSTVADVCAEFIQRYGEVAKTVGVVLYGDATGRNRTQQSKSSNWDIVREKLSEAGIRWTFRVRASNPLVVDRRNAMMAQFRTGEGYGMLIDPVRCPELVSDFLKVKKHKTKNEPDKLADPRRTHASDAAGYMVIESRRPVLMPELV